MTVTVQMLQFRRPDVTHTDTINLRKGTTTGQACDYCTGN